MLYSGGFKRVLNERCSCYVILFLNLTVGSAEWLHGVPLNASFTINMSDYSMGYNLLLNLLLEEFKLPGGKKHLSSDVEVLKCLHFYNIIITCSRILIN